jgi:hypothetical protein
MNGFPGLTIPDDSCFALVSDTDGGNLIGLYIGFSEDYVSGVELGGPDVLGPVFNPTRLRVNLFELLLSYGGCAALPVE